MNRARRSDAPRVRPGKHWHLRQPRPDPHQDLRRTHLEATFWVLVNAFLWCGFTYRHLPLPGIFD